jgi:hypothetical protein
MDRRRILIGCGHCRFAVRNIRLDNPFVTYDAEDRHVSGSCADGAGADSLRLPPVLAAQQDRDGAGQYFVAQSVYSGWSMLSFVLIPAMLINIALAVMLRGEAGFMFAVAGCPCMAATLGVFFALTYPANVATQNWTAAPPDWKTLRRYWEYSHAANAGLAFAAFCLVALASLAPRR